MEAAEKLKHALELDPNYGEACLGLGQVYVKLMRFEEAIPLFRRAVSLLPERVEPHHWLGRTLAQVGDIEEGRKELAQVERMNAEQRQRATETLNRAVAPALVDASRVLSH